MENQEAKIITTTDADVNEPETKEKRELWIKRFYRKHKRGITTAARVTGTIALTVTSSVLGALASGAVSQRVFGGDNTSTPVEPEAQPIEVEGNIVE